MFLVEQEGLCLICFGVVARYSLHGDRPYIPFAIFGYSLTVVQGKSLLLSDLSPREVFLFELFEALGRQSIFLNGGVDHLVGREEAKLRDDGIVHLSILGR